MSNNERVLIVAAHPDDELIGCGGTISKHTAAGDIADIMIMAEGSTSRSETRDVSKHRKKLDNLIAQAKLASGVLGVHNVDFFGLKDNRMDSYELLDIVKIIEKKVTEFQPSIIYTHHRGDLNIDHQITHDAVITACRPIQGNSVRKILTFETLSSSEWNSPNTSSQFTPQVFVNIESQWEKKVAALRVYKTEIKDFPHPRSIAAIEALAKLRGSAQNFRLAEAFMLVRHRIP